MDVARTRKVSNAGVNDPLVTATSGLQQQQQPATKQHQQHRSAETSVNENAKQSSRGGATSSSSHLALASRKSISEETSHVIKATVGIGRVVRRPEEDKTVSRMDIDVGEDAVPTSNKVKPEV